MSSKYNGMSTEELKALWQQHIDECYAIRKEIDRRAGNIPSTRVEFTDYLTD